MTDNALRQQMGISLGQAYSLQQRRELALLQCDYTELAQELTSACRDNPLLEEKSAVSCPLYPVSGGRRVSQWAETPFDTPDRSYDNRKLLREQIPLDMEEGLSRAVNGLIDYLDDRGFLRLSAREACLQLLLEREVYQQALFCLKRMGPGGIGCKDPGDYLAFQLKRQKKPLSWGKICRENLPWIALKQYRLICEAYGMDLAEAKRCCAHIATLNPFPLKGGGGAEPVVISKPELRIDACEGGWQCNLIEPLSECYELSARLREYRGACLSPEECEYVRDNTAKARFLLAALRRREGTLLRVGRLITAKQQSYLGGGALAACPQSEAARELGLNPSTFSRALRDKYLLFEGGIYPLSFFFQAGGGGGLSKQSIQDLIESLLKEAGEKRLSDRKIAERLLERHGIGLSRRTVAKYRKERRLPSGYYKGI